MFTPAIVAMVAVALACGATGCSQGLGEGDVTGTLTVRDCGIEDEAFDLEADYFSAEAFEQMLDVRIQHGSDYEVFSDGLHLLVRDATAVARGSLGAPLDIAASENAPVNATLFLNGRCRVDRRGVPKLLSGVSGTITFDAIYAPQVDDNARAIRAHFDDVMFADPGMPAVRFGTLSGTFSFFYQRGRPSNDTRDVLEGTVRDVARGGDAVVATERGAVFVPFAERGERVRIGALTREGKVWRGKVLEVLTPSADRMAEARCDVVAQCGGCPWMFLSVAAQRAHKLRFVRDAVLGRDAGRTLALEGDIELVSAGGELGYRRRARLAWIARRKGSGARVGYHARRRHEVVEASRCVVLDPTLDAALAVFRTHVSPVLAGEGEVKMALGEAGRAVVQLETNAAQVPELFRVLERLVSEQAVVGVSLRVGSESAPAVWGDPRERTRAFDGSELVGTSGGFSQANDAVNAALVAEVARLARTKDEVVLELFAGHGNLTVALAPSAARLDAVELDAAACAALRANVAARGLSHVRVLTADVASLVDAKRAKPEKVGVVVLDPPRTGARDAVDAVVARKPARIVYVSCDTATLARDLDAFATRGYAPTFARAFDMFPQTAHVEAVVLLERTRLRGLRRSFVPRARVQKPRRARSNATFR